MNLINKISYLQLMYSYYFYSESNKYYMISQSSGRKIKDSFKYVIIMNENEIIKRKTLFLLLDTNKNKLKYLYFYNSVLESKKRRFFKGSFYENKGKIKIIGRGWKIIKYPYELLIKLGYSHPIFLTLDPYLSYKLKKKKKKYYVFYSTFYNKVNTLMSKFHLMRVPDTYTRKGIFQRKVIL